MLLIGNINGAVCQKSHLPLVQVHVHQLVCSLSKECPSDQILSFWKCDFRKWFESISCCKSLLFGFVFDKESLFFVILLWKFQIFDLFAEVIDWLLESFGFTDLSGLFDVKNLLNWSEELRINLDFKFDHFDLPSVLLFDWESDFLFAFLKGFDESWYSDLFEFELLFVVLWLGTRLNDIYWESFFAHGINLDFIGHVLVEHRLLGGLHWIYQFWLIIISL